VGIPCAKRELTERLITPSIRDEMELITMADFNKRDAERKGGKKEEIKSKKLIEENLDDLRGKGEDKSR